MIEQQLENEVVLTTKQVIKYLTDVWGDEPSHSMIYYYVREGKLKAKYEDNWRIDGTLLFDRVVIEEFAKEFKRPEGYTLSEVSKIVGLHVTTLQKYIKDGSLDASKFDFKGKPTYFVPKEALTSLQESDYVNRSKSKRKSFFTRDKEFYLYQSFRNETTNDYGRIIKVENNIPTLLTAHGKEIIGAAIKDSGYEPIYKVNTFKRITKKDFAKFELLIPNSINSKEYRVFDFIYNYIGAENFNVERDSYKIILKIKPIFVQMDKELIDTYYETILILERILKEGIVQLRYNGLHIGTDNESITINVPKSIKEQIRDLANGLDLSIEDYIKEKLLNQLKEMEQNDVHI
ncbi:helix-turn-helix domain-containing protein [Gottfriedia sp. NPDC057948]|uniref:helix-turn-helix domain-containing protein n=1 Tax=Gottfriedia sp. NPDC057948 TaxID=3346287 RepID=UPI0036DDD3A7